MNKDEILARVREIVCECLDDDDIVITCETKAADVDGWDSLHHITILAALEDEFDVRFPMSSIGNAKNVGDIVGVIESLKNN